ncbi:hypothetical protein CDEE_0151 [Candidatus Kinetoplastibacterium crithidii TCC036E]|uniref:Lipoprotein n=1 Tax=Candidatus Kinetoplastidibacterium crithidiae TCC036E TaxID=1208918 RepID=M1LV59_9PROT|nr:hypothetical protein CDEE_0151 [Candidatus Kinetoplastibacterium crithidii TCC036E]
MISKNRFNKLITILLVCFLISSCGYKGNLYNNVKLTNFSQEDLHNINETFHY